MPLQHLFTARGALLPLAVICIALVGVIQLELPVSGAAGEASAGIAKPAMPPSELHPASEPAFALPTDNYAEVTERPLFFQTRRPAAAEPTEAADDPMTLILAGVVISNTSRSSLVQHGSPPILTRYKEGQQVDGWAIGSIQRDRIVLRRGTVERELKLRDGSSRPPGPSPR